MHIYNILLCQLIPWQKEELQPVAMKIVSLTQNNYIRESQMPFEHNYLKEVTILNIH